MDNQLDIFHAQNPVNSVQPTSISTPMDRYHVASFPKGTVMNATEKKRAIYAASLGFLAFCYI